MTLELLVAELGPGARGGFTTRAGGVSAPPWAAADGSGGLNLAFHTDDDPDRVMANRDILGRALGARVAWVSQRHGAGVRVVDRVMGAGRTSLGTADVVVADARASADPLAVAVMVADCVPLLLAGRDGRVAAAVHVGRGGLVRGAVAAALDALAARGAPAADLYASIGPSICGRCYEVPAGLRDEVDALVPGTATRTAWGTPSLDIAAGVRAQLRSAGVTRLQHHDACTREDERFYSFRRDGVTGRCAGVVRAGDTP
ncbi:polyphenol oxidase family protein [Georgenia sp. MJ206]|uniref:polyphenol oxidase family protein n=1 Tax=Georgenia wangjunii TaxID=3117730 RepID=UPI002F26CE5D